MMNFKWIEIINLALYNLLFFLTLKSGARTILYSSDNHLQRFFWTYDKKIHKCYTSVDIQIDLFPFMEQVILRNHNIF